MKKTNLIIFLFFIGLLSAQDYRLGVTANIHKTSIVNIHDYSEANWGAGLGLLGEIPLVKSDVYDSAWLFLSPQLEFSMQGESAAPPQGKQKFPSYYIGLPIYVKYFFHQGNVKRNFFLMLGPRLEFMVAHSRKGPEVYPMFVDQEKEMNKFGIGASVVAGFKLTDEFEAFVRYDRGFSKVYPDYTHVSSNYNHLLGIGVNYYFKNE